MEIISKHTIMGYMLKAAKSSYTIEITERFLEVLFGWSGLV